MLSDNNNQEAFYCEDDVESRIYFVISVIIFVQNNFMKIVPNRKLILITSVKKQQLKN